jgi:hypothetical protein
MSSFWDFLPASVWTTEPFTLQGMTEHQVLGWPQYAAPRPSMPTSPNAGENEPSGAAPLPTLFADNPFFHAPIGWEQSGQTAIGGLWPQAPLGGADAFPLPSEQAANGPNSFYSHARPAPDFFSWMLAQRNDAAAAGQPSGGASSKESSQGSQPQPQGTQDPSPDRLANASIFELLGQGTHGLLVDGPRNLPADVARYPGVYAAGAVNAAMGTMGAASAIGALARATGATAFDVSALSARAREIHQVLDQIARNSRTTAVLSTNRQTIIGGGVADLLPIQKALLRSGEVAAKMRGAHAEPTVLLKAFERGHLPRALATSRPICGQCAELIRLLGGRLTSPTTAVFPH